MAGRVEWTTLSGDDVENLVAILLLQEFTDAVHVRPSRGDAGIDVYVPSSDRTQMDVYQVKKFALNLTANQKSQIEESIKRLASSGDRTRFQVSRCYVTLPLNPTLENDRWLGELEAKYNIPLHWCGLSYLNGLVGKYPMVVDHYTHGGRQFLLDEMKKLVELLTDTREVGAAAETDGRLEAHHVRDYVGRLQMRLNSNDQFYSYDFEVGDHEPVLVDRPGLVASMTQRFPGSPYVTVHLFEKFRGATDFYPSELLFRPCPVNEDERQSFQDFIKFGLTTQVTAEFEARMPSGLGGEPSVGTVSIGPTAEAALATSVQRWEVLNLEGEGLAEVEIEVMKPVQGLQGGSSVTGRESADTFKAVWRFSGEKLSLQISPNDLTRRPVMEIQPGINFLAALNAKNFLRVSPQYGPRSEMRQSLSGLTPIQWAPAVKRLIDELAVIQGETSTVIRFPDLDALTQEKRHEINRASRLIQGEEITGTWGEKPLEIALHDGIDPTVASAPVTLAGLTDFRLELDGDTIDLGATLVHYRAAIAAGPVSDNPDGTRTIALTPALENDAVSIRRHVQA